MSDFTAGQVVRLIDDIGDRHFIPGENYEIMEVSGSEALLTNEVGRTRWVWFSNIAFTGKPARRRLGTKPEGDEFLPADDPRIAWLWEDAERFANQRGYCGVYDEIMECLGLPGRERDFSFDAVVDGFGHLYATITGRSEAEARAKFNARVDAIKALA